MKTPKARPRLIPRSEVLQPPEDLADLERRIVALDEESHRSLAILRDALREHGTAYFREWSKKVACAQPTVTIGLGRKKLGRLKGQIEELVDGLASAIPRELKESVIAVEGGSSGQIAQIVKERLRDGVRRVLGPIAAALEAAGYRRDETWIDERSGAKIPALPEDLRERIDAIADAVAGQEVLRSKILVFGEKKQQELAADLWESS